jgi:hypothetical protein
VANDDDDDDDDDRVFVEKQKGATLLALVDGGMLWFHTCLCCGGCGGGGCGGCGGRGGTRKA